MKYLLLPVFLLITSCASTSSVPQSVDLTGRLLGSYVSTSSGLISGSILHISDSNSIQKVSAIANGNPKKILLVHSKPDAFDGFSGKKVKVSGKLRSEHKDAFHTDFVMVVTNISEQ